MTDDVITRLAQELQPGQHFYVATSRWKWRRRHTENQLMRFCVLLQARKLMGICEYSRWTGQFIVRVEDWPGFYPQEAA